jgi:hypothetical protein
MKFLDISFHSTIMVKRNGRCVYEWSEGHSYDGYWMDDNRHGRGIQKWTDGSSYDGYWVDDNRHGNGIQKWSDGSSYQGEWENDKRHGNGVQKWSDGRSYVGQWVNNKKEGKGVFTLANGCVCECTWKDDKEIQGVATWTDGRTYKGTWANGHVGVGVLTYPDGDVFHVDTEAGIYVLDGDSYAIPNISIYHTYKEPVPGLGTYEGPYWKTFQLEIGLDNIYDLVSHFFALEQDPDEMIRFFEQVVPHDVAVSCTEFMVERWGKHTIPDGTDRYVYLEQFTRYKPEPLVHTHSMTFGNGTSCVYKTTLLRRLPNTLTCFDEQKNKVDWTCSICMSDALETRDIRRAWLECGHSFHNSCIFRWFSNCTNCPMCRSKTTHVSFTPNSIL